MIIQIAAMSKNRVIGKNNGLPWNIPEDMKFFRETTKGHCCIFGRKTFEAVGHPLPNRLNVVITRQNDFPARSSSNAQLAVAPNLEAALEICHAHATKYGNDIYICGGGEIYQQSMPITDRILLTVIHQDFKGDAYFPEFDESQFKIVSRADRTEPIPFSFLTYDRIRR